MLPFVFHYKVLSQHNQVSENPFEHYHSKIIFKEVITVLLFCNNILDFLCSRQIYFYRRLDPRNCCRSLIVDVEFKSFSCNNIKLIKLTKMDEVKSINDGLTRNISCYRKICTISMKWRRASFIDYQFIYFRSLDYEIEWSCPIEIKLNCNYLIKQNWGTIT